MTSNIISRSFDTSSAATGLSSQMSRGLVWRSFDPVLHLFVLNLIHFKVGGQL